MAESEITCDALRKLCEAGGKNHAVLVAIGPGEQVQLVTYGADEDAILDAHDLKEDIADLLAPSRRNRRVHESFIRDAAKNKAELDRLIKVAADAIGTDESLRVPACVEALAEHYKRIREENDLLRYEISQYERKIASGALKGIEVYPEGSDE